MTSLDKAAAAGTRELIAFLVGEQEFCVDVVSVREIRVWTPATPVAHAPGFVCGVINLRGAVLAIIDLAVRLGLPPTIPTSRHAILVVEIRERVVGLLVEGVSEILTVKNDMIQPAPDVASQMARDFVRGILAVDGRLISLLVLDAVLPSETAQSSQDWDTF
ncbi:chemotaxis protein CheW [Lichenifustis flavocetrariae]|uniref:Chemotaxis protein CheW n=1 Tax=Lichenifustis flavocetrariae TaxID=2949735 RepID=A0AA42CKS2_9HYPH|nr:chemotaxis protein CheW [Lichenifustis flavocetrariae]MCW6506647.1 chemotaxis protein CheW [Lichenifustis flavocetrariae]